METKGIKAVEMLTCPAIKMMEFLIFFQQSAIMSNLYLRNTLLEESQR